MSLVRACCNCGADCCTICGWTFNMATARNQGHINILYTRYNSTDCTGTVLTTIHFEADYDVQEQECGGLNSTLAVLTDGSGVASGGTNPDGSPLFTSIIFTRDGSPLIFGRYEFATRTGCASGGDAGDWYILSAMYVGDPFIFAGLTGIGSSYISNFIPGDNAGFASWDHDICLSLGDGTSVRIQTSVTLDIVDNTGCG